jgi:hypothetical protein
MAGCDGRAPELKMTIALILVSLVFLGKHVNNLMRFNVIGPNAWLA